MTDLAATMSMSSCGNLLVIVNNFISFSAFRMFSLQSVAIFEEKEREREGEREREREREREGEREGI